VPMLRTQRWLALPPETREAISDVFGNRTVETASKSEHRQRHGQVLEIGLLRVPLGGSGGRTGESHPPGYRQARTLGRSHCGVVGCRSCEVRSKLCQLDRVRRIPTCEPGECEVNEERGNPAMRRTSRLALRVVPIDCLEVLQTSGRQD